MVVRLNTFCTHFHWEVLNEHCCRYEENAANYTAKCSNELHATLHASVQEHHELPRLTAMITARFVDLEQNWDVCTHSHLPMIKNTEFIRLRQLPSLHCCCMGLTTGFLAAQYWYCQWFYNYKGGHNGRSK